MSSRVLIGAAGACLYAGMLLATILVGGIERVPLANAICTGISLIAAAAAAPSSTRTKLVYKLPMVEITGGAFVLLLALQAVATLPFAKEAIVGKACALAAFAMLTLEACIAVFALLGANHARQSDKEVGQSIEFAQQARRRIAQMLAAAPEDDLLAMKHLEEAVRFMIPVSTTESMQVERRIEEAIEHLAASVETGQAGSEPIKQQCQRIERLINQRDAIARK